MLKRRTFLLGSLAGLFGIGAWRYYAESDVDVIAMVVRQRLAYLKLDEDGVMAYSRDLVKRNAISSSRLHVLGALAPLYRQFNFSSGENRLANGIRHGEDRIVSGFLISSDFFINGSDETRVVKYLGYFDGTRGCGNPFARPAVDA